jgi:hypothetical protein
LRTEGQGPKPALANGPLQAPGRDLLRIGWSIDAMISMDGNLMFCGSLIQEDGLHKSDI